jgi:hypothetical protein
MYSRSLAFLCAGQPSTTRWTGLLRPRIIFLSNCTNSSGVAVDFITSVNAGGTDQIAAFVPGATFAGVTGKRLVFSRSLNGVNQLVSVRARWPQ